MDGHLQIIHPDEWPHFDWVQGRGSHAVALSADWPVCRRGQRSTTHQSRESERAAHQLVHVSLIISFVYKNLFISPIASLFPFLLFDHTDMVFPSPRDLAVLIQSSHLSMSEVLFVRRCVANELGILK